MIIYEIYDEQVLAYVIEKTRKFLPDAKLVKRNLFFIHLFTINAI